MKPIVLFMFLVAFCSGCNSDSRTGKQYGILEDKSEIFRASLDIIIPKDDNLCLYYTTDGSSNFVQSKSIWKKTEGRATKQQIVFSLPKHIKPTQLRIDLGNNQSQQDIYLKKITLSYKGKTVELPGTVIFSYFMPDVTKTTFDATTGLIQGEGKNGIRQSPSLYPKEGPLGDEIEKLVE